MNIRETLVVFELGIQAAGTSEGAGKGWDSRGRGRKDQLRQLTKHLGLPGGKGVEHNSVTGAYTWRKRGGYFRKMADIHEKAESLGFKRDMTPYNSPDGNYIGRGNVFTHPSGWKLHTDQSFGPTKDYNDHSIRLEHPELRNELKGD